MIIYKDILTGDEMFSDTYKIEELEEAQCLLKVTGKSVQRKADSIDESAIGGNASAEAEPEESSYEDGAVRRVIDIVDGCRLQPGADYDKATFMASMKPYVKAIKAKLECEKQIAEFQKGAGAALAYLKKRLANYEVFLGESQDPDGTMGFLDYEEDGVTPFLLFFKHALMKEKQ